MTAFSRIYESGMFFWILWGIELVFMLWWLISEMNYQYLKVNPFVYVGLLWLLAALVLHMAAKWKGLAFGMVGLGAIPLAIMGVFLLIVLIVSIFSGPIRWN